MCLVDTHINPIFRLPARSRRHFPLLITTGNQLACLDMQPLYMEQAPATQVTMILEKKPHRALLKGTIPSVPFRSVINTHINTISSVGTLFPSDVDPSISFQGSDT